MTSDELKLQAGDSEKAILSNLNKASEEQRIARDRHNGMLHWAEKLQRDCK